MVPSREDLFKYFGISHMVNNDTIVYLCHQTIFKMVPEFDRVFRYVASVSVTHDIDLMLQLCRDILKRNPNAILLGKVFAQHITFVLYVRTCPDATFRSSAVRRSRSASCNASACPWLM